MSRPARIPDRGDVPPAMAAQRLGLSLVDFEARRAELRVPQNLDHLALGVVVHTGESERRQTLTNGAFALYQPTSGADPHKIPRLWCHGNATSLSRFVIHLEKAK
jgi:hypothetical protein